MSQIKYIILPFAEDPWTPKRQCADLPGDAPTLKATWSFDQVIKWSSDQRDSLKKLYLHFYKTYGH